MDLDRISVLGAGAWGTALANYFASIDISACLWSRDSAVVTHINANKSNVKYLPEIQLHNNIIATNNIDEAIVFSDIIFIVVPSQAISELLAQIKLSETKSVIICSKGIDEKSCKLFTQIFEETYPNNKIGILSGPNFAKEIAKGLPATTTLASKYIELKLLAAKLSSDKFKFVYTTDVITTQIIGAAKNILAIGCGIVSALNIGHNALSSLFYLGVQEIMELSIALGGKTETLISPAGLGDLFLTCSSNLSRNFKFGTEIVTTANYSDLLNTKLCEGYFNCQTIYKMQQELRLKSNITSTIYNILYQNEKPSIIIKSICK